jgi:hypothetical protein
MKAQQLLKIENQRKKEVGKERRVEKRTKGMSMVRSIIGSFPNSSTGIVWG